MSEKYEECYFAGKDENGNPIIMYDAYMYTFVNAIPKIRADDIPGILPKGSIFFKTTGNPDVQENYTEPLYLADGNNMFYVNANHSLRPIIDRTPRVFIGTTLPEGLPIGSLFIKTIEEPNSTHGTGDLHYEGMYYVFDGGRMAKLVPNA